MGCLTSTVTISGGDLKGSATVVRTFRARAGIVCDISLSEFAGYEVLWASDGLLLTVDGKKLYVRKQ